MEASRLSVLHPPSTYRGWCLAGNIAVAGKITVDKKTGTKGKIEKNIGTAQRKTGKAKAARRDACND